MKLAQTAFLSVLMAIAATSVAVYEAPAPVTQPERVKLHPKVVKLEGEGISSGVVIAPDWVLTCAHCATSILADGLDVVNSYVGPDNEDIALLRVPGITADHYPAIAAELPRIYDPLRAYGWHLGKFLLMTEGFQGDDESMSTPAIPGASGGAVVNRGNEVVGVIQWVYMTSTAKGDDAYAVPHVSGYTQITDAIRVWIDTTLKS